MKKQRKSGVVFRFRRPSSAPKKPPSRAMKDALLRLSEAEEMRFFSEKARVQNRVVVVEVYHAADDGHPFLIHTAAVPKKRA